MVASSDDKHLTRAKAIAPDSHSRFVDLGRGTNVIDGIAIASRLNPSVEFASRLAVANSKIAVIIQQDSEARLAKGLRISIGHVGNNHNGCREP